ncbi:MAG: sigma-54-dependent Fis family transcriptional regulator [Chitinispirillaceae bacterium]|nr:sigma-54-dependent Fis family transcriptional regulator [Chitinispirillaceae bacterium]
MEKILIVDDDYGVIESITSLFTNDEYEFLYDDTGKRVFELLEKEDINTILLDVFLGDVNGVDVLEKIRLQYPEKNVVMISGESDIETALRSVRAGAFDFIEKPFSKSKLRVTIKNSIADYRNRTSSDQFQKELLSSHTFGGESEPIGKVEKFIAKVARSDIPVLITGENGTGKEIAARRIHYLSERAAMPFVAVNCASIPKDLLESELFGYRKGAFTGAIHDKEGLFVKAAKGTLFLDEIGDMPLALQSKILRVLQEKEITRLGDTQPVPVAVRVLSATNQDINRCIAENRFREDLYYRINGVQIELPPLRERKDDIRVLTGKFINEYCYNNNLPLPSIGEQALRALNTYDFPGNVRELRNIVHRTLVLLEGNHIDAFIIQKKQQVKTERTKIKGSLMEVKKELLCGYLQNRLDALQGNRKALADELDIHVNNLYRLLREC